MQTGTSLRQLFASLLLFCTPTYPNKLWVQFQDFICDDLAHRIRTRYHIDHPSQDQIYDLSLYLLEGILNSSGKSLANFSPMPQPVFDWNLHTGNTLITNQLDYNCEEESNTAATMVPQLNPEQQASYDAVLSAVLSGSGRTFFLSGPGGTGKTFVYCVLCHKLRGMGVTFGSDRIRTYRGKTKRRVRRTAIDCPPQNACRRNEYKNRGDTRWPEPSRRFRAFRRTSERYEGEVSNISSEVLEYKYTKYIY